MKELSKAYKKLSFRFHNQSVQISRKLLVLEMFWQERQAPAPLGQAILH